MSKSILASRTIRRGILYLAVVAAALFYLLSRGSSPAEYTGQFVNPAVTKDEDTFKPKKLNPLTESPIKSPYPMTAIPVQAAGFFHFTDLYLMDGTYYVVAEDPTVEDLPELRQILSTGIAPTADNEPEREPTRREMRFLSFEEAKTILGLKPGKEPVLEIPGFTIILNDPGPGFFTHYYHYWAELIFGAWRSYTLPSSDPMSLPPPQRIVFPHSTEKDWRDRHGINAYLTKLTWPGLSMMYENDWVDWEESGRVWRFERVVLVDRSAGHRGPACADPGWFLKMNADILTAPATSPHWYQPIRQAVLKAHGAVASTTNKPVITYISRQGEGRSLRESDHKALVAGLETLKDKNEVIIANMGSMSLKEQVLLAGRTTVMLGVHGNGLSHLVWMDPTPKSTVIEIFPDDVNHKPGFNYDYALPAISLGLKHYSISNKDAATPPNHPGVFFPDDFHRKDITVDADTVIGIIRKRLGQA